MQQVDPALNAGIHHYNNVHGQDWNYYKIGGSHSDEAIQTKENAYYGQQRKV